MFQVTIYKLFLHSYQFHTIKIQWINNWIVQSVNWKFAHNQKTALNQIKKNVQCGNKAKKKKIESQQICTKSFDVLLYPSPILYIVFSNALVCSTKNVIVKNFYWAVLHNPYKCVVFQTARTREKKSSFWYINSINLLLSMVKLLRFRRVSICMCVCVLLLILTSSFFLQEETSELCRHYLYDKLLKFFSFFFCSLLPAHQHTLIHMCFDYWGFQFYYFLKVISKHPQIAILQSVLY